ncbi:MAG: C39 family peptidase, partial [Clostridia bacterium]|nr:C39 family peptidase [Clostridia bacterium]
ADMGGNISTYTYDADGIRNAITSNGVTTNLINLSGSVIGEITPNGTTMYYRAGDRILYSDDGTNNTVYTYNGHGDVIKAGTFAYTYDAFGNPLTESIDGQPFMYCGEYYDQETGMIYLRNRYYDPSIGRFISEDPIRDGLNWYVYCAGNPVMFSDPTGTTKGQIPDETGYGGIYNPYDYVNDKYGNGWEETDTETLSPDTQKFLMNDLERNVNNCTLVSITRIFAYHRDNNGKTNIPDNETLYNDIKEIAESHGYNGEDGTFPTKIDNIIDDALKKYGYEGEGKNIYLWDFNTVKQEIDAGRPLLFNIPFGYYENHTVTVVGYKEYSRDGFLFSRTRKFIEVYDGWTNSKRFIDYKLINFGSFSTANFD